MSGSDFSKGVKWGIIGVGDVCEVKSGPAFYKAENSSLLGVMRRTLEKAGDYARRHQVPFFTNNADELLQKPEINSIYIATHPDTHLYYTKLAAQAGKAVYVEKPMARNFVECQEMIKVCEAHDVSLFVG